MSHTHTQLDDELITIAEAAKIVGVSVDTIRRYDKDGRLHSLRTPSNHRRFHRSEVEALLSHSSAGARRKGAAA